MTSPTDVESAKHISPRELENESPGGVGNVAAGKHDAKDQALMLAEIERLLNDPELKNWEHGETIIEELSDKELDCLLQDLEEVASGEQDGVDNWSAPVVAALRSLVDQIERGVADRARAIAELNRVRASIGAIQTGVKE